MLLPPTASSLSPTSHSTQCTSTSLPSPVGMVFIFGSGGLVGCWGAGKMPKSPPELVLCAGSPCRGCGFHTQSSSWYWPRPNPAQGSSHSGQCPNQGEFLLALFSSLGLPAATTTPRVLGVEGATAAPKVTYPSDPGLALRHPHATVGLRGRQEATAPGMLQDAWWLPNHCQPGCPPQVLPTLLHTRWDPLPIMPASCLLLT